VKGTDEDEQIQTGEDERDSKLIFYPILIYDYKIK
jgi:hypothetical protein